MKNSNTVKNTSEIGTYANNQFIETTLTIFEVFSIFWITYAILALGAALLGIFTPTVLFLLFVAEVAVFYWLVLRRKILIKPLSKFSLGILIATILLGVLLSSYTNPTIFGGRDEGSYSSSAILLSQDDKLIHKSELVEEFYEIYGPGKALNFPGFYYTQEGQLKSQFLPGYPAWLAIFYELGGVNGLRFANLFPFITFLFSLFLVSKMLLRKIGITEEKVKRYALISFLIMASSLPLIIFYKLTLSEIFFAALAWFGLFLILKYLNNKALKNYVLIFLPLVLMSFVRIEAIAIVFFFVLIMILKDANHLQKPRYQLPFIFVGLSFLAAIIFEPNFFLNSIKNVIPIDIDQSGTISEVGKTEKTSFLPDDWQNFYLLKIFFVYNVLALLMMAIFVIARAAFKFRLSAIDRAKKDISKINSYLLIPFVFFFPTIIYLVDANISLDHPWLLRRFIFSIIPVAVVYSGVFLAKTENRNKLLSQLIAIGIIAVNISLFFPGQNQSNLFNFRQNKNLLEQTEQLSKNFSPQDLVLISQKSSGSKWSLMSAPMRNLFGLNAVYFFNPEDLEEIDVEDYENIYLVTSKKELELYQSLDFKERITDYKIENQIIKPSRNASEKPKLKSHEVSGSIYEIAAE